MPTAAHHRSIVGAIWPGAISFRDGFVARLSDNAGGFAAASAITAVSTFQPMLQPPTTSAGALPPQPPLQPPLSPPAPLPLLAEAAKKEDRREGHPEHRQRGCDVLWWVIES